jgi:putative transposase
MARLPRLYAPGIVQHVLQRPAEGRALFTDADDYALFTRLLADAVRVHGLALHAYVLLPTQVRLLGTPEASDSVARTMQAIGRRYVGHLNRKTGHTGALWHRRYRSTLIDAEAFLMPSMRMIEQQPSQALRETARRWSSLDHHLGREQLPFIVDHAAYWALSDTPFERQAVYRALVETPVESALVRRIDDAVEHGWVLGDAAFVASLGDRLTRRPAPLRRGRPRKIEVSPI